MREMGGWRIEFWDPERGYMQAERDGVRLWAFGTHYSEAYRDLLDEIQRRGVDGGQNKGIIYLTPLTE
jgi:hypothetical protein